MTRKHAPVLHQEFHDEAQWRNSTVPAWVPPHMAWRFFVAGFVVMIALGISTVLVWMILDDQTARTQRLSCRAAQENRILVRALLQEANDLIPNEDYRRLSALARPDVCQ